MVEETTNYDGQGLKGALWTVAGTAIGSVALNALKTMNGGGGMYGGNAVTQTANAAVQYELARKDAEIAMLKSDAATDSKLVQVYTELRKQDKEQDTKISNLNTRVTSLETSAPLREQIVMGQVQSVANAATGGIANLQTQICGIQKTLGGITATYVPATQVTPLPMEAKNSWTAPTGPTV